MNDEGSGMNDGGHYGGTGPKGEGRHFLHPSSLILHRGFQPLLLRNDHLRSHAQDVEDIFNIALSHAD